MGNRSGYVRERKEGSEKAHIKEEFEPLIDNG